MYRRNLFSGAASLAALIASKRAAGAAQTISTAAAGIQVCVGNSQFALPDNLINDTVSNSLNSRKICFAPQASDITDIVLAYPGFGLNSPEQDLPSSYTVRASIEYPLGTVPRQVFFNGASSATIPAGRTLTRSDPLPIRIPAGAQFAAKTFATWTPGGFWLGTWTAAQLNGEWTARGTDLTDHTLDNVNQVTSNTQAGFGPVLYGTLCNPSATIAVIGDSIGTSTSDFVDTTNGYNAWGRAMRGQLPFINLARGTDTLAKYLQRPEGRGLLLRNAITHCIMQMGANDLFGGVAPAVLQGYLQAAIGPLAGRGIKCYATTLTPRTTSTDGWLTSVNQTLVSSSIESARVSYNQWLRQNWYGIGLSGIFDIARAVDPGDTGKWASDTAAIYAVIRPSAALAVVSGGVVTSAANFTYGNGGASAGGAYPSGAKVIPCAVFSYPNTGGTGAAINAITDMVNPWVASYSIVSGGSGYTYPPMIATQGNWTGDGTHPNGRGWNEILRVCQNIAPETFIL